MSLTVTRQFSTSPVPDSSWGRCANVVPFPAVVAGGCLPHTEAATAVAPPPRRRTACARTAVGIGDDSKRA